MGVSKNTKNIVKLNLGYSHLITTNKGNPVLNLILNRFCRLSLLASLVMLALVACNENNQATNRTIDQKSNQTSATAAENTQAALQTQIKTQTDSSLNLHFDASKVYTVGRTLATDDAIAFAWPGVSLNSKIKASDIAVRIHGQAAYFQVSINGKSHILQTQRGEHTYVLAKGLDADQWHDVSLFKRNESHTVSLEFKGWLTNSSIDNIQALTPEQPKPRIQFFTDSLGVGMGNESTSRECNDEQIALYTNHQKAFPSLTAKAFHAEHYSQSYSGLGVVRNWGGNQQEHNFQTYIDAVRLDRPEQKWDYSQDKADLVVFELGTNDFSVKLNEQVKSERWSSQQALAQDWTKQAKNMLSHLREQYGEQTPIIVVAGMIWPDDRLRPIAQALVNEQAKQYPIYYVDITSAVKGRGCQWHPDVEEHKDIAQLLINKIRALQLSWAA